MTVIIAEKEHPVKEKFSGNIVIIVHGPVSSKKLGSQLLRKEEEMTFGTINSFYKIENLKVPRDNSFIRHVIVTIINYFGL